MVRRVAIVDDDARIVEAVRWTVTRAGHAVEQCFGACEDVVAALPNLQCDTLIVDLGFPLGSMRGAELVEIVGLRRPEIRVVILTGRYDAACEINRVLGLVKAVLTKPLVIQKPFQARDLLTALEEPSPDILMDRGAHKQFASIARNRRHFLSERQADVLFLSERGMPRKDIAAHLGTGLSAVDMQLKRARRKLRGRT